MREVSDTVFVTTDDGSYADKGLVTDKLRQLIENGTRIDLVLAVGPIPMMRAVAEMTRKEHIRTVVSLNPIMIDGTGHVRRLPRAGGRQERVCLRRRAGIRRASRGLCRAGAAQCHVPRRGKAVDGSSTVRKLKPKT
jgi:NAD(P)H-flavin reductase